MTPERAPWDVDVDYLWRCFECAVAADTGARVGENRIDPDDPRVAEFASEVAAPTLEALGATVDVDELNNVVAAFGPLTGNELALVSYCAIHHGNEMSDSLRAVRLSRDGAEIWRGLGASQGKGGFAAVCAALDLLRRHEVELAGSVAAIVSSEASSTHRSAESLFARLRPLPFGAVLTVGTGNRLSLGNRGRVDVVVEIPGEATHSSAPERGSNPIPRVGGVLERLGSLELGPERHELLGGRSLVPYKLICGPVAPHTIPSSCTLVLDRRLLPGDDPAEAVAEVATALAGLDVEVTQGAAMLPALVDADACVVTVLQEAAAAALGRRLEAFYPPYTFDAGYACALGVPAVMCGPATSDTGGSAVLSEDVVSLEQLRQAAALYAAAIASLAGDSG
jgi:acetylornithine deacetylase/succinyl-diaminopimelate desuccinylase-like protein